MTDTVTYGAHYTRNLGNFENAKVYYEVTTGVNENETLDDAKARIEAKVDNWVEEKVAEIDSESKR